MQPAEFLKHFMLGDVVTDLQMGPDGELLVVFDSGYRLVCQRAKWKWERIPGLDPEPKPGERTQFGV